MKKLLGVHHGGDAHWVGDGFPVRTVFSYHSLGARISPFLLLDYAGPAEFPPSEQQRGVEQHPHRGFETVTYIIDGIFEHQDSNGGGGVITNGDTQWMTAGAGILHIEKPPEHLVVSGGLFHGLQLWVNLPKAQKWADPRYQDLRASEVVLFASADAGSLVRVIAGEVFGRYLAEFASSYVTYYAGLASAMIAARD